MNRQELLDALTAERYDNRWWATREDAQQAADALPPARRRRLLAEDFEHEKRATA